MFLSNYQLTKTVDGEWWQGDLAGQAGFFPSAFVEVLQARPARVAFSFNEAGNVNPVHIFFFLRL